ncbi:MAG: LysE family translocator [Verrucomicrobia bacterium]|nr:LysE family translocator [Verrucomicrobiota bacterium]MDE3098090.1 LysE family transporter [Verrucomicrobiota bacterium]
MSGLPDILLAAVTGFGCALFFSSIPVGPINLTIINEGSQRGFKWAWFIGFGASIMEAIYCALSFTGFSSFFGNPGVKAVMEVLTFVFLLFLGAKFLFVQSVNLPATPLRAAAEKIEARLEQKLHPRSAFLIGFVRVMGNLGVFLFWIVLTGNFMSHDWVADALWPKAACVGGVALGTNAWFFALCFAVSRGHGRFSEATLLRLQRLSGVCLLVVGLFDGTHIVWQLARHRMALTS